MIQEVLKTIEGVATYPLIGLLLFFGGFIVILILTWRMKPGDVDYVSRLPLDGGDGSNDNSGDKGRTGQ